MSESSHILHADSIRWGAVWALCGIFVWGSGGELHAKNDAVLPLEKRTNGGETLKSLQPLLEQANASQVAVGASRDSTLAASLVAEDGYVLTKASEAEQYKPWKVFLQDGSEHQARLVKQDPNLDLLLLKIEKTGMKAVNWSRDFAVQAGQWLCSLTDLGRPEGRQIRIGVMSAKSRKIPNSGVLLGILMGPGEDGDGVLVEEVAEDSPAEQAGLQADDLLLELDGVKLTNNRILTQLVSSRKAGDVVKLRYSRQGMETEVEVRLASRSKIIMSWGGENFADGGTSIRTDDYPKVIQHEIPLQPTDMGSVLYDLQGNALGLNIARVDRVTTFALPAEVFAKPLQAWMEADRKKQNGKKDD